MSPDGSDPALETLLLPLERVLGEDVQVALLGNGEGRFEEAFRGWAARRPDRFCARIAFDNAVAHRIEAGADLFLMPSRYEPCGLNQMYSLRYGTVPVVRATGGLEDTVEQVDPKSGEGTGFKFTEYRASALMAALRRALAAYHKPEAWKKIMLCGMKKDFSWDHAAEAYEQIYRAL